MTQTRAKLEKKIDKYARKGRFDKAILECQKLLAMHKGDLQTRQKLAELLAQDGNDPEAIRTYFKLAKRYIKNGLPQQAVRIFNRILKLDPGQVDTRLQLADLALEDRSTAEAISHLVDAAEQLARRDNIRTSLQVLDRINQIEPDNHEHRLRIAGVFAELGQANTAASEFAHAMLMLKRSGRIPEAVEAGKRAIDLDPTNVEVLCELGEAFSDLDQWKLVERIEKRVKSIGRTVSPTSPEAADIPIDVEEPPAKLGSMDLIEDSRTTEEVAVPNQAPVKAADSGVTDQESDIYAKLFGPDDESEE